MRVAFLHPDLGLGGAERLVVDAATALTLEGHEVEMFTSHYDPGRCFEETKDGAYFPVAVYGDWMPREVLGSLHIVFAMLRNAWLALCVAWLRGPFDVIICDQVSVSIPVLRLFTPRSKILFYCHFPDQLLSARDGWLKSLYRLPFDAIEEVTTLLADMIVVNSSFTAGIFAETFACARGMRPGVVYPCIRIDETLKFSRPSGRRPVLLSINRFERKKNLSLAIEAFGRMRDLAPAGSPAAEAILIMAGGYDPRLAENRDHYAELQAACARQGLTFSDATAGYEEAMADGTDVVFVRSFSDADKAKMLKDASLVVYTPRGEHFGIVPIEAMASWRPVLAVDDAGPKESVVDGSTGFLVDDSPEAFAERMLQVCSSSPTEFETLARAARARAKSAFSHAAMREQLHSMIESLVERPPRRLVSFPLLAAVSVMIAGMLAAYVVGE